MTAGGLARVVGDNSFFSKNFDFPPLGSDLTAGGLARVVGDNRFFLKILIFPLWGQV